MNADVWPLCLPKRDWQEVRSLADAVTIFTEDLVNRYRPDWNLNTPPASFKSLLSGGRKWYLRREAGLQAFARYEAKLRLKHFSKDGLITGAEYCACRLQEVLFDWGWREALAPGRVPSRWKQFISWPGITLRLQLWKSRNALARYSPDPRIKLYAQLYDRGTPCPLEFCSEDYSATDVSEKIQCEDWPGKGEAVTRENVRRWRRSLGLTLSEHVVIKFPHARKAKTLSLPHKETGVMVDFNAAKAIELPFELALHELSAMSAS